eukprot:4206637-Pleurochrysis_carterae.AAC.1
MADPPDEAVVEVGGGEDVVWEVELVLEQHVERLDGTRHLDHRERAHAEVVEERGGAAPRGAQVGHEERVRALVQAVGGDGADGEAVEDLHGGREREHCE